MHFSLYSLFDLGGLSKDLRRSLGLIYASSVMVIMGINLNVLKNKKSRGICRNYPVPR